MQERTQQTHVTIKETARRLDMSQQTVRRLIADGKLPAYRVPGTRVIRVRTADLEGLFEPENPAVVEARKRVEA